MIQAALRPGVEEVRVTAGGARAIEIVLQPTPLVLGALDATATRSGATRPPLLDRF